MKKRNKKYKTTVALIKGPSWLSCMNNAKTMSEFVLRMSEPISDTDNEIIVFKTMLRKHFPIDIDENSISIGVIFKHEIKTINEICMELVKAPRNSRKVRELLYALDSIQYSPTIASLTSEFSFIDFIIVWLWKFIHGKTELLIGKCERCGKLFLKSPTDKKFCSFACSSTFRSKRYREKLALMKKKGVSK